MSLNDKEILQRMFLCEYIWKFIGLKVLFLQSPPAFLVFLESPFMHKHDTIFKLR
jgi:hypothetical protein